MTSRAPNLLISVTNFSWCVVLISFAAVISSGIPLMPSIDDESGWLDNMRLSALDLTAVISYIVLVALVALIVS